MSRLNDILDFLGDKVVGFFESLTWFIEEHPLLTMVIFIILFFGGCEVAVKVHIVSSSTKLMPY